MIEWTIDKYGWLTITKGEDSIFIQRQDDVESFLESVGSTDTTGITEDLGYFN